MEKKREEDLSPEELHARIEEDKKKLARSGVLAFSALVAIIVLCIAWFVSNNKVSMTSGTISADIQVPFELASVGSRQEIESEKLLDNNNNSVLVSGSAKDYGYYVNIDNGEEVSKEQTYYTGSSSLAWHLNGQESFAPGSGGTLEFYLIPKNDNLTSVTVKVNLTGYIENDGKAVELNDDKIQNLLNGHILFFRHRNYDTYGYYDWLGEAQEFTVTAPSKDGKTTFEKDVPYKVTLYWKWPQYFRNYIYTIRTEGDLFTDQMVSREEYLRFIEFINKQNKLNDSKLFYNPDTVTDISDTIDKNMSEDTLNNCSQYYNQADDYIGKNAKYVYIQIQVS